MSFKQLSPGAVAHVCRVLGRLDDVGEEHRGEEPLRFGGATRASYKGRDFVYQRVGISSPRQVIDALKLDKPRAVDRLSERGTALHGYRSVLAAMQHQRWRLDERERSRHVDTEHHVHHGPCHGRTGRGPSERSQEAALQRRRTGQEELGDAFTIAPVAQEVLNVAPSTRNAAGVGWNRVEAPMPRPKPLRDGGAGEQCGERVSVG
ncbi:MAG: hypothetical protein ACR2JH_05600 [Solirubrobacteraceae bacterium]